MRQTWGILVLLGLFGCQTVSGATAPDTKATSTYTLSSSALCNSPTSGNFNPSAPEEWEIETLVHEVSVYLNNGGDLSDLPLKPSEDGFVFGFFEVDFDGDERTEVVLYGYDDSDSVIAALTCTEGMYTATLVLPLGRLRGIELVDGPADFNGDGKSDLFLQYQLSGNFCYLGFIMLGHLENTVELVLNVPPQVACGTDVVTLLLKEEVVSEIQVKGYTSSSMMGGPTRPLMHKYTLDISGLYSYAGSEYEPASYRIHVLADAQAALDEGDLVEASRLYNVAASEDGLEETISPFPGPANPTADDIEEAHTFTTAFSWFRLAALGLVNDSPQDVEAGNAELATRNDEAAQIFFDLLLEFSKQLDTGLSPEQACATVARQTEASYPDLEQYIGFWGHANVSYNNTSICPFGR